MKHILVVDDDHDLAALLALALERRGYQVDVARNGREALERVCDTQFDLLLVDWHMPIMGAATFLDTSRRLLGARRPPVVIASGTLEVATRAIDLGAAAFIAKPFRLTELLALVHSLIGLPGS
jgi:CheY-like chemotaxis protein